MLKETVICDRCKSAIYEGNRDALVRAYRFGIWQASQPANLRGYGMLKETVICDRCKSTIYEGNRDALVRVYRFGISENNTARASGDLCEHCFKEALHFFGKECGTCNDSITRIVDDMRENELRVKKAIFGKE